MMEATAVSLTRTVLDGVLGSVGTAMADEAALLLGVPREVEFIRSELQMMQSFLRVQSSAACSDGGCYKDTVRTCVKQVRDLACDLEDCLLDFTMTMHASRGSWLQCAGPDLAARHRVADRIRLLKASLEELNQRNQRYNVFAADASVAVAVERSQRYNVFAAAADGVADPNLRYVIDHAPPAAEEHGHGHGHADDEYQLTAGEEHQDIKRNNEMKELDALVTRVDMSVVSMRVVSVWGMGGMGKSSLVRMLYNDRDLIDGFDGRAWVTVSHPLDCTDELKRRLKKQLGVDPSHGLPAWLGKKCCLVVVDDVSSQEEWELISKCLGTKGPGSSRVVVTTRREDVAQLCAGKDYKYKLEPLKSDEAEKLFFQKVYKNADHTKMKEMTDQSSLILKRCQGLPLAIATIGGLLANRPKTSREWMNLRKHLGSELESDRDIKRVITSSYDGLPYHLKSCFLYLSIFPENHEIRFTRLLRRWMAEGYITKPRDMSIEEVGWRYYNQLISRSMIQPSEKARDSMAVERCHIHGVVLQIIMSKSIEENQLFIMDKHCNDMPQSKIRHLAVTKWKRNEEKMVSINLSQVRSLTIFGKCPPSLISSKLRLLRVLDLEDTVDLENDDLKHIGGLLHLRYLGLRNTNISRLPSSLQNLRYLETLDVQDTKVTQLPVGITKLEKLRYLVCGINFANDLVEKTRKNSDTSKYTGNLFKPLTDLISSWCGASSSSSSTSEFSVAAPERIEKLWNLQALGVVHITEGSEVAKNLGKLTSLRRLGVQVDGNKDVKKDLCSSVERLVRLERLEVRSESLEFLKDVESPPKHLTALRLSGSLNSLPSWMMSLSDLAKVKLIQTRLRQDDIEKIGKLQNLTLLALWEESFAEESLRFGRKIFKKLKLLYIEGLKNISSITIKDGALPLLENLQVRKCNKLHDREEGLSSVLSLVKLNELVLKSCGDKPELEKALQKQISGSKSVNRPKLIIGKSIVTKPM